jgi:hypothetical protein
VGWSKGKFYGYDDLWRAVAVSLGVCFTSQCQLIIFSLADSSRSHLSGELNLSECFWNYQSIGNLVFSFFSFFFFFFELFSSFQEQVKKTYKTIHVTTEVIRAASTHSIVNLTGTFPITFKGVRRFLLFCFFFLAQFPFRFQVTYNLPLHVRVLPDFPASSPVVFLVPTPDMAIVRQHRNVDTTGRCYFPYLSSWTSACTLTALVKVNPFYDFLFVSFFLFSLGYERSFFGGSAIVFQTQDSSGATSSE